MKKLLLRTFPIGQKLNIIDHQHIRMPVTVTKSIQITLLHRSDKIIHKRLARHIRHSKTYLVLQSRLAGSLQ